MIYRFRSLSLIYYTYPIRLCAIVLPNGRMINFPDLLSPLKRARTKIRELLPRPYVIGFRDCDLGGRVYLWVKAMHYGAFDFGRFEKLCDGGDGPAVIHPMTFYAYFKKPHRIYVRNVIP